MSLFIGAMSSLGIGGDVAENGEDHFKALPKTESVIWILFAIDVPVPLISLQSV